MGALQSPMISALPGSPAAALLARERQSRRVGSGIQIEQLPGCWMLQQTWRRNGDASAPGTATLLRWLQASLTLSRCDQGLSIVNQVCLAGFRLRFKGLAQLKGSRPLLIFSFTALELSWSGQVLLERSLPSPKPQRLPFFALIELNEQQGTLTARGRGGGLAQWSRSTLEAR
tara:strand:+ start:43 stop:561 length:519 start_codon:yes stop_codon:yes gene_type:complete